MAQGIEWVLRQTPYRMYAGGGCMGSNRQCGGEMCKERNARHTEGMNIVHWQIRTDRQSDEYDPALHDWCVLA